MTEVEVWIVVGITAVFVGLLAAVGWGMLLTRGLDRPAIDKGKIVE